MRALKEQLRTRVRNTWYSAINTDALCELRLHMTIQDAIGASTVASVMLAIYVDYESEVK